MGVAAHLKTILVSALLLAHLAVPAQLLQTGRFYPVAHPFWGTKLRLRHCDLDCQDGVASYKKAKLRSMRKAPRWLQ